MASKKKRKTINNIESKDILFSMYDEKENSEIEIPLRAGKKYKVTIELEYQKCRDTDLYFLGDSLDFVANKDEIINIEEVE